MQARLRQRHKELIMNVLHESDPKRFIALAKSHGRYQAALTAREHRELLVEITKRMQSGFTQNKLQSLCYENGNIGLLFSTDHSVMPFVYHDGSPQSLRLIRRARDKAKESFLQ